MRQHQQRTVDAIRRVQNFLDDHAVQVGTALATSPGRGQLDTALTRLDAFGIDQGAANLEMAGQLRHERSLVKTLRSGHMHPIATFARARLRGTPGFAALTRPVGRLQRGQLLAAAQAMATAAVPHADALTLGGFPADTIAQLGAAADALVAARAHRASTKVRRITDTRGIREEILAGREAVAMLNAVLSRQFNTDPTFLAGWHAARRFQSKSGATRIPAAPPVVPPAHVPVPPLQVPVAPPATGGIPVPVTVPATPPVTPVTGTPPSTPPAHGVAAAA